MSEDFEQHLRRQSPRAIPAAWRAEILQAAPASAPTRSVSDSPPRSLFALLTSSFSLRWAPLAAAWLVIFLLNHSARETTTVLAGNPAPQTRQALVILQEQRRLLAELSGTAPIFIDRPPSRQPRPHSQRREATITT